MSCSIAMKKYARLSTASPALSGTVNGFQVTKTSRLLLIPEGSSSGIPKRCLKLCSPMKWNSSSRMRCTKDPVKGRTSSVLGSQPSTGSGRHAGRPSHPAGRHRLRHSRVRGPAWSCGQGPNIRKGVKPARYPGDWAALAPNLPYRPLSWLLVAGFAQTLIGTHPSVARVFVTRPQHPCRHLRPWPQAGKIRSILPPE